MATLSQQRPSTSSTASDSTPMVINNSNTVEMGCQAMAPPTIITSSGTPATSPTLQKGRRDSTTQCGKVRRSSRASPERTPRLSRLQRQVNVKKTQIPLKLMPICFQFKFLNKGYYLR
jgi:hypothetical protein